MKSQFDRKEHQTVAIRWDLFYHLSLMARRGMFDIFMEFIKPSEKDRVLDVGVSPEQEHPSINFFEDIYPWPNRITATSISDCSYLEKKYPGLTFVRTDGQSLPFRDREYDIVFCSAVLEHVGSRDKQKQFVSELCRVARNVFVTTPNRWHPMDFHTRLPFLHWLPVAMHRKCLRTIGFTEWADEENLNLLDMRALNNVFSDSRMNYRRYKLFGWRSNLIAWKNETQS
jgi:Methylase involved in ubiquinone/menaquinone biosynthesis